LRSQFAKSTIHYSLTPMSTVQLRNHIRTLRFEHGMTQEELALRTGVSRQTIMSIERGQTNPSVLLAYKIAAAFGVIITSVFDMEGRLAPV
jgi:putative transcriptional regulator